MVRSMFVWGAASVFVRRRFGGAPRCCLRPVPAQLPGNGLLVSWLVWSERSVQWPVHELADQSPESVFLPSPRFHLLAFPARYFAKGFPEAFA
jgi:hypothetical protein